MLAQLIRRIFPIISTCESRPRKSRWQGQCQYVGAPLILTADNSRFLPKLCQVSRPTFTTGTQSAHRITGGADLLQKSLALLQINYSPPLDVDPADNKLEEIVTSKLTDERSSQLLVLFLSSHSSKQKLSPRPSQPS